MMQNSSLEMLDDNPDAFVSGSMTVPSTQKSNVPGSPDFYTLDEPVSVTIMRDLKAIGLKFYFVLFPKESNSILKEWDLWGPLFLCTFMAMFLQESESRHSHNEGGPQFAQVFVIVWIGSMIITLNSKLLGGNISFFQSVCVLGYCLLPTAIALLLCRFILFFNQTMFLFFLRFAIGMSGFAWASYASMKFLGNTQKEERRALAVYPIVLFYFIISWLVISHTN